MNHHNRWMTTLTVLLGSMAMGLSATMPIVALPAMMVTFDVGQADIQWLMTGFQIMATTPVLATGWLSTRFGLRRTYMVTLLMFVAFSLLGTFATTISLALAVRLIQGIAMGLIPALALIAVAQVFPANALGLAMGIFGIGAVLAPAVGPYLAGILLEPFGWQASFSVPLLLCLPALLLALKYIPGAVGDTPSPDTPFDWLGMALITIFMFALLNVSGLGLASGWGSGKTLGCLGLAVFMLVAFVGWQRHSQQPLLELTLFRNNAFRAVLTVAVLYGFCLYGTSYLVPYFLQSAAGYSPEDSGAIQVPGGLILIGVIFFSGIACDRWGARAITLSGLAVVAISCLCFTFIANDTGFWMLATWFALNRVGMGMLIPAASVAAIQSVPATRLPYATSTLTFFLGLGGAVGINAFSILYQWQLERKINITLAPEIAFDAFQTCFLLAMVLLMAALVAATWIRRHNRGGDVSIS